MRTLDVIAAVIVVIGALNWGLVGAFNFNLVQALFSAAPALERLVYILVGAAGLYQAFSVKGIQQRWKS